MSNPILTLVVPCYNAQDYMERCIESLLAPSADDIEIVIVNDGSSDRTAEIADRYCAEYPETIRAVHKENGGHGSGINAGLAIARGTYFKVVDADDWLDATAYSQILEILRAKGTPGGEVDLIITNFVYEKQGKKVKRVVDYRRALPKNRVFTWDEVRNFRTWQYLLMHSMIYRTELLRACNLHVPENSFYVDNYFAFVPLTEVRTLGYFDVDLYRYFIGRDDQSVNEKVMISRIDQQIGVNLAMVRHLSEMRRAYVSTTAPAGIVENAERLPDSLNRYMTRYASLVTVVSSALLVRAGTPEALAKKDAIWQEVRSIDPRLCADMQKMPVGYLASRSGGFWRFAMRAGYSISRLFIGFN